MIKKFKTEEAWLKFRKGKISGTKLSGLLSKRDNKPLLGYYQLIAERVAEEPDEEDPMLRGRRLEAFAIDRFRKETKKKVNNELIIFQHDKYKDIILSPDGMIGETEAVEVKCLSSARHIEAWVTKKIPKDYEFQVLQYFLVNKKLKKLYFVFYDPRVPVHDFFFIEVKRSEVKEKVDEYLILEKQILLEIKEIVKNFKK